jgi:hypothetical protein
MKYFLIITTMIFSLASYIHSTPALSDISEQYDYLQIKSLSYATENGTIRLNDGQIEIAIKNPVFPQEPYTIQCGSNYVKKMFSGRKDFKPDHQYKHCDFKKAINELKINGEIIQETHVEYGEITKIPVANFKQLWGILSYFQSTSVQNAEALLYINNKNQIVQIDATLHLPVSSGVNKNFTFYFSDYQNVQKMWMPKSIVIDNPELSKAARTGKVPPSIAKDPEDPKFQQQIRMLVDRYPEASKKQLFKAQSLTALQLENQINVSIIKKNKPLTVKLNSK